MSSFVDIAKIRESLTFLATRSGLTLVGINFGYALIFGFLNLLAGIFIFGPATLLLQGQHIFMWVILPFLSLIFLVIICVVTICIQFIVFYALSRHDQNLSPLVSWDLLQNEVERFKLYFETVVRATLEVILGLVFLIIPGVVLCLKYVLIGPVAVFEYDEKLSAQDVLSKSALLTENIRKSLFFVFFGSLLLYLFLHLIFGAFISRLIIGPFIMSFLAVYLVKVYKN